MDAEQIGAMLATARRFARRDVAPMVGTEGPDGNLASVHQILKRADELGLRASADQESPGHDYGVWGRAVIEHGAQASLAILQEVAEACAGVACCLHVAGLGALELADPAAPMHCCATALFHGSWRPSWMALQTPPDSAVRLTGNNGHSVLHGAADFVYVPPGCQAFVVYAASDTGWQPVVVDREAEGLVVSEAGLRCGLRALGVLHLGFRDVTVAAEHRLAPRTPECYLRRLLLGLSAIAIGNARGARRAAFAYAAERYQGGAAIAKHPAVRLLLGDAASRIEACRRHLDAVAQDPEDDPNGGFGAAAAKLRITTECHVAVSDCLQTLGGYGYMEDYRLEKRLRDAMTLKSMALKPDDLRLLCSHGSTGDER